MLLRRSLAVACAAVLATPAYAFAVELDRPDTFSLFTGALSLVVAVVLLVLVLQLRKVADGSAMAENVSYVVAATLCFAAAVLVNWVDRFVPTWMSAGQVRAGSDLLLVCAMFFFAVYFARVYRAMTRFLKVPDEWKLADEAVIEGGLTDPEGEESSQRAADGGTRG
jgi:hypothetical protein